MSGTQVDSTDATPPSPHSLDFDRRYYRETALSLVTLLRDRGPTLAIGAPTVARLMQADGYDITLVDRQPLQGVRDHVVAEATEFVEKVRSAAAMVAGAKQ